MKKYTESIFRAFGHKLYVNSTFSKRHLDTEIAKNIISRYGHGPLRKIRSLECCQNAQHCTTRHDRMFRRENSENRLGIVALGRQKILSLRAR